jgi:hypothetical protein
MHQVDQTIFMEPIDKDSGAPKFPVGQIIFDINGEYANANLQDKGTAIFELYSDITTRFSTLPKPDSNYEVNFYNDLEADLSLFVLICYRVQVTT